MKTWLNQLFIICVLIAVFNSLLPASAEAQQTGNYYGLNWRQLGSVVEITGYNGSGGAVSIPNTIPINGTNMPVTSIGNLAFYSCNTLTSITIPAGVTEIGEEAFGSCANLTSVTLPEGVTSIGVEMFIGCANLENIVIPNSVSTIAESAFQACGSLKSITLPNNLNTIGDFAFEFCTSLSSITIPGSVTSFGIYVFDSCSGLNTVTIENGVQSLGTRAFSYCTNLSSVTLPNSIISIGSQAFFNCSSLASITIPNSVTSIGFEAFCEAGLKNITIPSSVTYMGPEAFAFTSITTLTLEDGLASVGTGNETFAFCAALTAVTIPKSVTSIAHQAFAICSLTNVCFEGNAPADGGEIFAGDPLTVVSYIYGTSGWGSMFSSVTTAPCVECGPLITAATISGQVTSSCNNSPVTGATVQIGTYSTTTANDGSYTISNIAPGTYTATISDSGCVSTTASISVTAGQNHTQNFDLTPFSSISGTVYNACNNQPLSGATVQAGTSTATTDASGHYTLTGLAPGSYAVSANLAAYSSASASVTVSSCQSTTQNLSLNSARIDYFGIGVDWSHVDPSGECSLRGDINADNLYLHLQTDLNSYFNAGVVVALDGASTSVANLNAIMAQFQQFKNSICPNDTVVFYVDAHAGNAGSDGVQISLASDFNSNRIFDAFTIANMLRSLPTSTRKIVFLDTCHSGGMAAVLANLLGDAEILAASSANGVAQFKCAAGSNDGMSEFTTSLIANLDSGIYDFHKIAANIQSDANGTYASDIGLNLGLEDSGSAIFTGILPQLWEGPAFTGNLTNSAVTIGQLPPNMIRPQILNGIFEVTLTNIPNSGSIAIELSTNLVSWLQVSFNPATGTNQTFSFAVTNNNSAFFRALSVQ